ncbi:MAG TPA: hypothetical protein VI279_01645 [Rhodocyclaceae bacterium]
MNTTKNGVRFVHMIAPVLALIYPFSLQGFHFFVTPKTVGLSVAAWVGATCSLLAAFLVPLIALTVAVHLSRQPATSIGARRGRRIAYLAVASPPLFTFIGVLMFLVGNPVSDVLLYCGLWIALLSGILVGGSRPISESSGTNLTAKLRVSHGAVAAAVLALFLLAHIGNHMFGLVGSDAHIAVMKDLRQIYRNFVFEPLLLIGFLYLIGSGALMAWRFAGSETDGFRALQVASGIYLLFFLVSHINAVLVLARTILGIDSDWGFATGAPTGLIHDAWNIRLLPLYVLSVFFALTHPLLGARVVMLNHGKNRDFADKFVVIGATLAAVSSVVIILGMCGLRLAFV